MLRAVTFCIFSSDAVARALIQKTQRLHEVLHGGRERRRGEHLEIFGDKPRALLGLSLNHERTDQQECGESQEERSHGRLYTRFNLLSDALGGPPAENQCAEALAPFSSSPFCIRYGL